MCLPPGITLPTLQADGSDESSPPSSSSRVDPPHLGADRLSSYSRVKPLPPTESASHSKIYSRVNPTHAGVHIFPKCVQPNSSRVSEFCAHKEQSISVASTGELTTDISVAIEESDQTTQCKPAYNEMEKGEGDRMEHQTEPTHSEIISISDSTEDDPQEEQSMVNVSEQGDQRE